MCAKTVISLESVDQQSLTICHMLLSIPKLGSYCAIMGMPLPFPFCCHFRFPYRLEISSSSLLPPHVFIHFLKLELPSQAMKYMWNPMSPFTILYGVSGKDVVRRNGSWKKRNNIHMVERKGKSLLTSLFPNFSGEYKWEWE